MNNIKIKDFSQLAHISIQACQTTWKMVDVEDVIPVKQFSLCAQTYSDISVGSSLMFVAMNINPDTLSFECHADVSCISNLHVSTLPALCFLHK